MLKLGFVFPGQGSQYVGMGKELAESFEAAEKIYTIADKICGFKISSICFEGPQEVLDQTKYAQPALLVTSLACLEIAKGHGLLPSLLSGLSLGEYTALVAAGSITLEEALPLVMTRAELMQGAVPVGMGGMAAILGLDNKVVEDTCNQVDGIVTIANYNSPGQLVISGEKRAVEQAAALLKEAGGKAIMLAVSVPSHSPLMRKCSQQFAAEIAKIHFIEPSIGVVSNVNATENSAADFPQLLEQQLYSPVKWEYSIRYMLGKIDKFIEIGPGSSLAGLIKKIDRSAILGGVENNKTLQKTLEKVNQI
jgi:[acyl-carrier-protein] S-malonyltransferase